ncbi:hypothetical protein M501DRAFT_955128 [Patellaria atrata CBS 101060]|uniref:Anaphase-promoting complex subunit 2 n=1 Tax=Patellaria atrata CBS 101060 TaxID=1346257 RepID=A0A9P4S9F5_9PEZI|nr:hypothetical protein M501DRAFT_955128 [Patellaria atrata CBS 101060]
MATAIPPQTSNRTLLFSSIFPSSSVSHTTPTPIATPILGSTAPGQSFGGFGPQATFSQDADQSQDIARDIIRREKAWSIATRFLSSAVQYAGQSQSGATRRGREVDVALRLLLAGAREGTEQLELVEWYSHEVREHYLKGVREGVRELWRSEILIQDAGNTLAETISRLHAIQAAYLQPLVEHIIPIIREGEPRQSTETAEDAPTPSKLTAKKFTRDLHALFVHSIPQQRYSKTLAFLLYDAGCRLFRLHSEKTADAKEATEEMQSIRKQVPALLRGLQEVGLGDDRAQRAFAHAMDKLMDEFIISHYMKVDWYGKSSVTRRLRQWVKEGFAPFVKEVMQALGASDEPVTAGEVQQWQDMAIGRLGRARVDNLFDYIVAWDNSLGAVLDLKEYIASPIARTQLTSTFSNQISRRLLHAGATTTHIIDIYIFVIRAFTELDPKCVLLDRVARPIRRYLKDREDTPRVIISSLLTDTPEDATEPPKPDHHRTEISLEVAKEIMDAPSNINADHDFDWGNMNWTPDPIDAGPEYKAGRSDDVLSYLLSLYDRDDFIAELKTILGEHLLRNDTGIFDREIILLELFKKRLGDDKLQACEVMLRDVEDSRRIDASIRAGRGAVVAEGAAIEAVAEDKRAPGLHAQILSSFFWPPLREETFCIPPEIKEQQEKYERGFEAIKGMRKLHWLHALGRVKVELAFEDRKADCDVATWQAAVIYAFQDEKGDAEGVLQVQRTVQQLVEQLEMDEALVRQALAFWVAKYVLRETSPGSDTFSVLERLPTTTQGQDLTPTVEDTPTVSAVKTQEDLLMENMGIYRQFVMGMLTNGGNMDARRVHMMLKMTVPGGFPFAVEDVAMLLRMLESEGAVVRLGEVWGMKR